LENQSATVLADSGYDVVQNPVVPGPKNPDYLINGAIFDNYAPSTGNVRNIASTISDKVTSGQASNIVVNLSDSSATPAALQTQLANYPVPGLKQVIVVDQSGAVIKLNIKGN
jgi:filamentous hemagglutinin